MNEQRSSILLCLLTRAICITVAEDFNYFSPSGVALFEQLCLRTVVCGRFLQSSRHISCGLHAEITTEQGPKATFKVFPLKKNKKLLNLNGKKCQSMTMILQSKRNRLICRARPTKNQAVSGSKMLIIKQETGDIKQLYTGSKTISQYFPAFDGAYGMAYVPNSKKLVYCDLGRKLHMMALNGSNRQLGKKHCLGVIGVAEDRVFIFTSRSVYGRKIHYSMSHFGTNMTKVTHSLLSPDSMAVDMKRRQLFISSKNSIYNYDYMGHCRSIIDGYWTVIEPFSEWMYIVDKKGRKYIRMSLTTFKQEVFRSRPKLLEHTPPCIVDNILYAITVDCDIMIISKTSTELYKTFEGYPPMCTCCSIYLP